MKKRKRKNGCHCLLSCSEWRDRAGWETRCVDGGNWRVASVRLATGLQVAEPILHTSILAETQALRLDSWPSSLVSITTTHAWFGSSSWPSLTDLCTHTPCNLSLSAPLTFAALRPHPHVGCRWRDGEAIRIHLRILEGHSNMLFFPFTLKAMSVSRLWGTWMCGLTCIAPPFFLEFEDVFLHLKGRISSKIEILHQKLYNMLHWRSSRHHKILDLDRMFPTPNLCYQLGLVVKIMENQDSFRNQRQWEDLSTVSLQLCLGFFVCILRPDIVREPKEYSAHLSPIAQLSTLRIRERFLFFIKNPPGDHSWHFQGSAINHSDVSLNAFLNSCVS
ncbi:hypothetical protein VP01_3223g3 [Puccinia sorghi]|uniref:Uncharacterized protein n=1 Tax=Puccinia sorghi TaxID=27349 RepID=A0A0L6UZ44_9BASI|nr:hypothetical protein VP01_3223g3 [Puccinia sorghi]